MLIYLLKKRLWLKMKILENQALLQKKSFWISTSIKHFPFTFQSLLQRSQFGGGGVREGVEQHNKTSAGTNNAKCFQAIIS